MITATHGQSLLRRSHLCIAGNAKRSIHEAAYARNIFAKTHLLALFTAEVFITSAGSLSSNIRGAVDKSAAQAESSNLSNIEHRAVIKYFVEKGKTPKEIFEDMVSVLQESAPSYTMVKNGLAYFNKDERAVKMILAQGVL
ncbi:hypothetical protein EVAR_5855_1 [Eumeta japonica]|uniref:Mos1 transposase HTH domain-containing protein n=1 Tax=Eumeta variegata TaxID=151549 RepID=A0A4C1TC15_EUMVA|nr:hypothetical protein EVAR_5855_1 [Eumeta japonica]